MQYSAFKKAGWPIGSGAVESAMRRIVNLRLKGAKCSGCKPFPNMCALALLCQGRAVAPPPSLGPPFHPFAHTLKHKKRGRSLAGRASTSRGTAGCHCRLHPSIVGLGARAVFRLVGVRDLWGVSGDEGERRFWRYTMTVIVGVLCQDGVVVGSDSSATLTAIANQKTIEQSVQKTFIVGTDVIFTTAGEAGLAQRFEAVLRRLHQDIGAGWYEKDPLFIAMNISRCMITNMNVTFLAPGQFGAAGRVRLSECVPSLRVRDGRLPARVENRRRLVCLDGHRPDDHRPILRSAQANIVPRHSSQHIRGHPHCTLGSSTTRSNSTPVESMVRFNWPCCTVLP